MRAAFSDYYPLILIPALIIGFSWLGYTKLLTPWLQRRRDARARVQAQADVLDP